MTSQETERTGRYDEMHESTAAQVAAMTTAFEEAAHTFDKFAKSVRFKAFFSGLELGLELGIQLSRAVGHDLDNNLGRDLDINDDWTKYSHLLHSDLCQVLDKAIDFDLIFNEHQLTLDDNIMVPILRKILTLAKSRELLTKLRAEDRELEYRKGVLDSEKWYALCEEFGISPFEPSDISLKILQDDGLWSTDCN